VNTLPTSPATFSTLVHARRATQTRRAMGTRRAPPPRTWIAVAIVGGAVAFLTSLVGSFVFYLTELDTNDYAELLLIGGFVIGLIAIVPGVVSAAVSAVAFAWRSPRAMWIAGVAASAAGPLALWLAFFALSL
jgi:hypothetical protein